MSKEKCLCCLKKSVTTLIDFGSHPPSNRFEKIGTIEKDRHRLRIGQCLGCGMIQLIDAMRPNMVKSHYKWIKYNEPEGHLDALVDSLIKRIGEDKTTKIFGLTYKDSSILERLKNLGFSNTYCFDMKNNFSISDDEAGLESIQEVIDTPLIEQLQNNYGKADVLLIRHFLEHVHDPLNFLQIIKLLVKPEGYIVFEVPDCTRFIEVCDYPFIWEEHITYLNSYTMRLILEKSHLLLEELKIYPYTYEDSLVAIVKNTPAPFQNKKNTLTIDGEIKAGKKFSRQFVNRKEQIFNLLTHWHSEGKNVAIYGAGHMAAKFLNFYEIGKFFKFVIDDDKEKQKLLMPDSRLVIVDSSNLEKVDYCLLILSPESESIVYNKNKSYLDNGGVFYSIFASNVQSIYSVEI